MLERHVVTPLFSLSLAQVISEYEVMHTSYVHVVEDFGLRFKAGCSGSFLL
jgi:hypothetical protein